MLYRGFDTKEDSLRDLFLGPKNLEPSTEDQNTKKCSNCVSIGGKCPECGYDFLKAMGMKGR